MKRFTATTLDQLPTDVISRKLTSTFFGYTIWKNDVIEACGDAAAEIQKFIALREEGVCDKVDSVTDTFNQLFALNMFMQDNELEVIFYDQENEATMDEEHYP